MALLGKAVGKDYFNAGHLEMLQHKPAWDSLRMRPDFQKVLEEVAAAVRRKEEKRETPPDR